MELKDELEVSGEVADKWDNLGYNQPDDVPEGEDKSKYRELLKALGFDVRF